MLGFFLNTPALNSHSNSSVPGQEGSIDMTKTVFGTKVKYYRSHLREEIRKVEIQGN